MSNQRLKVRTRKGTTCPRENGGQKIGDKDFVEVPSTPYYRACIRDGSLVTAEIEKAEKDAKKK